MPTFTPQVDAESFVRAWLAAQFPGVRCVVELPANLADVAPVLQVVRFGGTTTPQGLDSANIDFDYFDVDRGGQPARINAKAGAGLVRSALLLHLPGYAASGAAVQSVTEVSGPRWVPYDNTGLRRVTQAHRITIHSIPN